MSIIIYKISFELIMVYNKHIIDVIENIDFTKILSFQLLYIENIIEMKELIESLYFNFMLQ